MKRFRELRQNERGAMLVQGAVAFLALLAMTTFVVDFGVMWVGRGTAQNSADAAALAGATAMAYDSMTDLGNNGVVKQSAYHFARGNTVIDQSPDLNIDTDITFPPCPDGSGNRCVRVEVRRGNADANGKLSYSGTPLGNPLPMIFGGIMGMQWQSVRATATAEAAIGNASNCLKPWVIPDRWQENNQPPTPDTFNKYVKNGNNIGLVPNPDQYIPSTSTTTGSGYNLQQDYGTLLTLKAGSPQAAIQPGWFFPVDLPLPPAGQYVTGGSQYRTNIYQCTGWPVSITSSLPAENGNMVGPTIQGLTDLYNLDPGATWNPNTKSIDNSCAATGSCPPGPGNPPAPANPPISPRVAAIALVDPDALSLSMLTSGGKNITLNIVNIIGFFINAPPDKGGNVTGYIFNYPGLTIGTPTINPGSAFTVNVMLVR